MLLQLENPMALWGLIPVAGLSLFMYWQGRKEPRSYSRLRLFLCTLSLGLLVIGLSRPQLGHQETQSRAASSRLVLALDISRSMIAEDTLPNRLQFSIAFARKLLNRLSQVTVAIFPFSAEGFLQMPFTHDVGAASDILSTLDPTMITDEGTDFTRALENLVRILIQMEEKAIKGRQEWTSPQVVLFSDGESHEPIQSSILGHFRKKKIPIHTVSVGTPAGATISIPKISRVLSDAGTERGIISRLTESETARLGPQKQVKSRLVESNLKRISEETGGSHFPGSFSEINLMSEQISRALEFGRLSVTFKADQEFFPILFILAFLLLSAELSLGRWHYLLRLLWPMVFTLTPLALVVASSANANNQLQSVKPIPQNEDPKDRSIRLYNLALNELERGDFEKAAENFQECVFIGTDNMVKKKALYNLGNALMKMMDPSQALDVYQQAFDLKAEDKEFEAEAQTRISENIALASRTMEAMKAMAKGHKNQSGQCENEGSEGNDSGGPLKDYDTQKFSEKEKEKIYDLLASEEQDIMKRQREKKHESNSRPGGKQW